MSGSEIEALRHWAKTVYEHLAEATPQVSPTLAPTATLEAVETATSEEPTATPLPTVQVIEVEPISIPIPGDTRTDIGDLPLHRQRHPLQFHLPAAG